MKQLTLIISTLFVFASCSKKSITTANNTTNTQQPSGNLNAAEQKLIGNWMVEFRTDTLYDGSGKNYTHETTIPPLCGQDDIYIFKSDKTYILDEGKDTCTAGEPYGPWKWSITYDMLNYQHGPNPAQFTNRYYMPDDSHFSVQWLTQGWKGQEKYTYHYKRK